MYKSSEIFCLKSVHKENEKKLNKMFLKVQMLFRYKTFVQQRYILRNRT